MGLLHAIGREYTYITSIGRSLYRLRHTKPDSPRTISDIVEEFGRDRPGNIAILYQDRTHTYAQLNEAANRYAHWAMARGIGKGDAVALFMENRPEYLFAWLGIVKLGGVVALINTNLRGQPLAHSIGIANAHHAIVGSELADVYREAAALLETRPVAWVTGAKAAGMEDLDAALAEASAATPDIGVRDGLVCKDNAFYIYTSGTTGLPKAANFSHMRMLYMMYGFAGALNAGENDRMYDTLPMYHSTGGVCAPGVALTAGGSLVIRRKFSVHEFWTDIHKYRPTFFQYIGELCRYLLANPQAPTPHSLRLAVGNGLSADIWETFQNRFAIPQILEFYAATEGNFSLYNAEGKIGAIGRISRRDQQIGGKQGHGGREGGHARGANRQIRRHR